MRFGSPQLLRTMRGSTPPTTSQRIPPNLGYCGGSSSGVDVDGAQNVGRRHRLPRRWPAGDEPWSGCTWAGRWEPGLKDSAWPWTLLVWLEQKARAGSRASHRLRMCHTSESSGSTTRCSFLPSGGLSLIKLDWVGLRVQLLDEGHTRREFVEPCKRLGLSLNVGKTSSGGCGSAVWSKHSVPLLLEASCGFVASRYISVRQ